MADPEAAALAWLLGSDDKVEQGKLTSSGVADGAIGVLRRLFQSFTGDPVGPGQQLAVGAAASGLKPPDLAQAATISIEAVSVRAAFDGTIPTAAVGFLLPIGTILNISGRDTLQGAQFIGTGAGAVVNVIYWT